MTEQMKIQNFRHIDQIDQRLRRAECLVEMLFGYVSAPLDEANPETVSEALLAVMTDLEALRESHSQLFEIL